MPDPIPTTDTKGKKPLSKNMIILIGGGAVILFLIYRAKKKKEEEEGPKPGTNPYTAQSFIPVTGENVAGAGASGGFGSVPQNPETNLALLKAQEENLKTITNFIVESQKNKSENTGQPPTVINVTGGGPPGSGQIASGAGSGGGGSGATTTTPPKTSPPGCGPGWKYNPAKGPPGPKSCYHISRETCKNGKCHIHGYQSGQEVCPC